MRFLSKAVKSAQGEIFSIGAVSGAIDVVQAGNSSRRSPHERSVLWQRIKLQLTFVANACGESYFRKLGPPAKSSATSSLKFNRWFGLGFLLFSPGPWWNRMFVSSALSGRCRERMYQAWNGISKRGVGAVRENQPRGSSVHRPESDARGSSRAGPRHVASPRRCRASVPGRVRRPNSFAEIAERVAPRVVIAQSITPPVAGHLSCRDRILTRRQRTALGSAA